MVPIDLHTHSIASGHGSANTIADLAKAASQKGLEVLGISDHGPATPGSCKESYFRSLNIAPHTREGILLLYGIEANILTMQGDLDVSSDTLSLLDYVIISLHAQSFHAARNLSTALPSSFDQPGCRGWETIEPSYQSEHNHHKHCTAIQSLPDPHKTIPLKKDSPHTDQCNVKRVITNPPDTFQWNSSRNTSPLFKESNTGQDFTDAYINAMKNPYVRILGHPDDIQFPVDPIRLVEAARDYHVVIEVNEASLIPGGYRGDTRENLSKLLIQCRNHSLPILLSSDSHGASRIGEVSHGAKFLRELHYPEEHILNYQPIEIFLNYRIR